MKILSHLREDISAGITSSILLIPKSMAFGIIVFAPLGSDYIAYGAISGMLALCFGNIGSAIGTGNRIINSAPFSLSSLMLASILIEIQFQLEMYDLYDKLLILEMLFFVILLSGLIQVIVSMLKIGYLANYIPYPVLAGLLNGAAILIIIAQIKPLLGLPSSVSLLDYKTYLSDIQILTSIVGLSTIFLIFFAKRITQNFPAPFLGMIIGTIMYYVFCYLGFSNNIGPVVGKIPHIIPVPKNILVFYKLLHNTDLVEVIIKIFPMALSLALVNSIRSLVVLVSMESYTNTRSNANEELKMQGFGNIVCSIFGGISIAGSQSSSIANFKIGGRTYISIIVCGAFALLCLLIAGPLVAKIPKVVLSATLVVMALKSFDSWSSALFFSKTNKLEVIGDISAVLIVTSTMVFWGIFQAIAVGLSVSLIMFIFRMSKEVVHRHYDAAFIRSNVARPKAESNWLMRNGNRIRIVELSGSLFFGNTEKLSSLIENFIHDHAQYIIIDFKGIKNIDGSGATLLVKLKTRCTKYNIQLFLSSVPIDPEWSYLKAVGAIESIGAQNCFKTIDDALSQAEDELLACSFGLNRYNIKINLSGIGTLIKLSRFEIEIFSRYLKKSTYKNNEFVFQQGDPADRLYFIVQGRALIKIKLKGQKGSKRIRTLCQGTTFGEMAVLDGKPRSADVISDGNLVCYYLLKKDLDRMTKERPEIAVKFLMGIGIEFSNIIRIVNQRISVQLE